MALKSTSYSPRFNLLTLLQSVQRDCTRHLCSSTLRWLVEQFMLLMRNAGSHTSSLCVFTCVRLCVCVQRHQKSVAGVGHSDATYPRHALYGRCRRHRHVWISLRKPTAYTCLLTARWNIEHRRRHRHLVCCLTLFLCQSSNPFYL